MLGLFSKSVYETLKGLENIFGGLLSPPATFTCGVPAVPFTSLTITQDVVVENNCRFGAIMSMNVDKKIPFGALLALLGVPVLVYTTRNPRRQDKISYNTAAVAFGLIFILYNLPLIGKVVGVA